MASESDKKQATDGDMATAIAAMQEAILKKIEEGFAALDIRIKALEEKAIGDGLVMKPADLQPLTSSGVVATPMAAEVAESLTTLMGLPPTNLPQFSQQFPLLSHHPRQGPMHHSRIRRGFRHTHHNSNNRAFQISGPPLPPQHHRDDRSSSLP